MNIRGTIQRKPKETPDVGGILLDLHEIPQIKKDLQDLKARHEQEHAQLAARHEAEHQAKMRELDSAIRMAKQVHKGDPGENAPPVNEVALENRILSRIPKPENGKDAIVDEKKIALRVAKLIPTPKDGKSVDETTVAEKVIELLASGKKKLHVKNLEGFNEGLEQTIAPIRHLAAGFRGGGDTVAAGSNVTITVVNGVKTISASGSLTGSQEKSTTVPNGSQTTFAFTHTPKIIYWNGALQTLTDDYTVSSNNITFTASAGVPQTGDKIVNVYA